MLALAKSSCSTLPRNRKCIYHEPMSSAVRSRSRGMTNSATLKAQLPLFLMTLHKNISVILIGALKGS